jgi:hypothetical protein
VDSWRRNQVAVTSASFVGFTGFTMVMPFLARYVQELGVTDVGDVALWSGLTLGVAPARECRDGGASMAERAPAIESAPSMEES